MAVVALKICHDYFDSFYYFSVSMFNCVSRIFLIYYNVDCTSKLTVQTKQKKY